ncbi:MAG: hypothetical protein LC808_19055 [Actinobacteria bacterium]|nr:hypothetical protein [Actinomycetota bacterium]
MPVQIQDFIVGTNIRVHVCGSSVFAVAIHADAVDYRSATVLEVVPTTLPAPAEAWCRSATNAEGLVFAGIDLIVTEREMAWYCLEVNPTPGYDYFENAVMQRGEEAVISHTILAMLLDPLAD